MSGKKWQEILTEVTAAQENELLKIDKLDIINYCLKNKKLRNITEHYLSSFKVTKKNSSIALLKKSEGNTKFFEKKYEESLQLYTESIFYAEKNDETLSRAYANRSLVLQYMDHLSASLADIDLALAHGYPEEKIRKLKTRKDKISKQLKFERGIPLIKENDELMVPVKNKYIPQYKLPQVVGGENKHFASASAFLSVYFDEKKGRHVIANEGIKIGDVLFVEKAFAFAVLEKACFACCKKTVAPIPCEKCLDVTYCSLKCRDESWKSSHFFQCGFGELFKSVGIANLGLQTIIAASSSFNELKNKIECISEPKYKKGYVSYGSKDYDSVYNLVHHMDKQEVNDLFQYSLTALLLSTFMKNHTNYFPIESGDQDLEFLTSVVLRHILQMICNGHAIMEARIRGEETSMVLDKEENRIATGIYPSASMMNHSCLPSVIIGFYKSYMVVQASRIIKKGEEVFNCYAVDSRRMKKPLRQKILREQYFFECKCEACTEIYDIQDKFTAFQCILCKGPNIQKNENLMEGVCVDCGKESQISLQLILKSNEFYGLLKEGNLLLMCDVETSLKKFLMAWKIGRKIFYKFHKDLSYVADAIAKCFAKLNNFRKCYAFLKFSVASVEKRFGSLSLELVQEYNKLMDVEIAILKSGCTERNFLEEVLTNYQKIQKIVNIIDTNSY